MSCGDSAKKKVYSKNGFALPTVLIASVVMLTVLLASISSTVAVRTALNDQYYNKLAQEAAEAGAVYAAACIANNKSWSGRSLTPGTDCKGYAIVDVSASKYIYNEVGSSFRLSFSVSGTDKDGNSIPDSDLANATVIGKIELLNTSAATWRKYTSSTNVSRNTSIATIAAPTMTSVTASTTGNTTTWSWSAVSCSGSTVRYQYEYLIDDISQGTPTASTAISISKDTTDPGRYTVSVQAQCYMDTTNSVWSVTSTASWSRPADPTNWIAGISGTALDGKYVRKTDLGSTMQYKTNTAAVSLSYGEIGLDTYTPASSDMSLFNPQTHASVDFSVGGYPAQSACKDIGGRLPTMLELFAIRDGRDTYGGSISFKMGDSDRYWSATESKYGADTSRAWNLDFIYGGPHGTYKTSSFYVRCVFGE